MPDGPTRYRPQPKQPYKPAPDTAETARRASFLAGRGSPRAAYRSFYPSVYPDSKREEERRNFIGVSH
jgi:hypothetical protein